MKTLGLGFLAGLIVVAVVRLLAAPLGAPTYSDLQLEVGFDLLPTAVVAFAAVAAVVTYRLRGSGAPLIAAATVAALLVLPQFWGVTLCPAVVPGCGAAVLLSPQYPPLALAGLLLPLLVTRWLRPTDQQQSA